MTSPWSRHAQQSLPLFRPQSPNQKKGKVELNEPQVPSRSDLRNTVHPSLLSLAQIPVPTVYLTCSLGQVTWPLSVRVLMGEINMTLPSLDRCNEPCTGECLHSLGSDSQTAPGGVGKPEALTCLSSQGLIYRYPLPGCQARGKWE